MKKDYSYPIGGRKLFRKRILSLILLALVSNIAVARSATQLSCLEALEKRAQEINQKSHPIDSSLRKFYRLREELSGTRDRLNRTATPVPPQLAVIDQLTSSKSTQELLDILSKLKTETHTRFQSDSFDVEVTAWILKNVSGNYLKLLKEVKDHGVDVLKKYDYPTENFLKIRNGTKGESGIVKHWLNLALNTPDAKHSRSWTDQDLESLSKLIYLAPESRRTNAVSPLTLVFRQTYENFSSHFTNPKATYSWDLPVADSRPWLKFRDPVPALECLRYVNFKTEELVSLFKILTELLTEKGFLRRYGDIASMNFSANAYVSTWPKSFEIRFSLLKQLLEAQGGLGGLSPKEQPVEIKERLSKALSQLTMQ